MVKGFSTCDPVVLSINVLPHIGFVKFKRIVSFYIRLRDGGNISFPIDIKIVGTDNTLRTIKRANWQGWAFNSFILVMLAASAYLVLKK